MSGRTKPGRRRPRVISANPVTLAIRRARLLPQDEINEAMAPLLASFQALREGVATEHQWAALAGAVELALSIERKRVGAITGIQGHLQAAETALAEIAKRARAGDDWRALPPHLQEIEFLDTFVTLHQVQLEQMTEGEFHLAFEHAVAHVRCSGGRVLSINELQHQAALPLTGGNDAGHP